MTILTVGSTQQFQTIKAAVAASQDGDTIYVQAGTYVDDSAVVNHKISLIGVGGMVHMVSTKIVAQGAIIANTDLTVDHFEFSGWKSWNFNGAGIRYHGGNLTVTNSYFHDNEDGLLGGPAGAAGTGSITITNSEFAHNGAGDGQSHNVYVGLVGNFTMTDSYTHDAVVGHEIKSRALNNTITNNRIDDGNGNASYSIDLPAGGNAVIANNIIHQGPHSQNRIIISYAAETNHYQWNSNNVVIKDNIVTNDLQTGYKPVFLRNSSASTPIVDGNTFYGLNATQMFLGNGALSNSKFMTGALPAIDTSHPWTSGGLDNIVSVGIGDDVLNGTAQNDLMVGGVGQDVFVIAPGGGNDVIADFNAGTGPGDVVQLVGTNFSSFADVQAAMSQHGSDVWLDLGKGEVLTFQNVDINSFAADDFTFGTSGATTSSLTSPVQAKLFTLPKSSGYSTAVGGTNGNDSLVGTSGADGLNGGKGADTMSGGAGNDHYYVDNANDVIVEQSGGGLDTVHDLATNYTLAANVENMMMGGTVAHNAVGNALNNWILALANDSVDGAAGNDILTSNVGGAQLTGGAGNDIFEFKAATSGMSTVTDFTIGQDLLNFHPILGKYTGSDPVADGTLSLRSDGHGGTIIAIDPTHSGTMHDIVDVQNIAPTALHMGYDYVF